MDLTEHYCAAGGKLLRAQLYEQAETAFRAVLEAAPNHPRARWGLSHALLGMGRYAEGWPLLRARFDVAGDGFFRPASTVKPEWLGQPLDGKVIAVASEQGFGDQIMMARFLPQLRAAGAKILLTVTPPLGRLLAPYADWLVQLEPGKSAYAPPYDYWTQFFSLPERFGATLETLSTAPYLRAPEAGAGDHRGRVGLVWRTKDQGRSLPESEAERLKAAGLVSLAPEDTGAKDFADTAAIIAQMPLVVTIDTAVAHLAGALGKPVWVMLPAHGVDWRWMRQREDSPWYPTARLFRANSDADGWAGVVDRVLAALG